MAQKSILNRLETIPFGVVWGGLLVVIVLLNLLPVAFVPPISAPAQSFYDFVDKLPPSSAVIFDFSQVMATYANNMPASVAVANHLWEKKARIISIAIVFDGVVAFSEMLKLTDMKGKKYGEDYVEIGFLPGEETGYAAFAKDIRGSAKYDRYGNPTADMPVLRGIKDANDIALFVQTAGSPYWVPVVRQFYAPYKTPIGLINLRASQLIIGPLIQARQLIGVLYEFSGAAEYEALRGKISLGARFMTALAASMVYGFALLTLGNIPTLISKIRKQKEVTK